MNSMIDFLSGAVALAYLVAGVYFLRFWRRTKDALFLGFAVAFMLLALNQIIASALGSTDERAGYSYLLRIVGFLVILGTIIGKNISRSKPPG